MRITESKIKRLIRQILLEKIDLPHPDEIQRNAYNQLIAGKSIEEIFPNHDREALKDKIKLLYRYIKEEELPVPKKIDFARFDDEAVSYEDFLKVFNGFVADTSGISLPEQEKLDISIDIFHKINKALFTQGSKGAQAREEANRITPSEFREKMQTAVRLQIQRIMSQLGNRKSILSQHLIERHKKYVGGELINLNEVIYDLQEELKSKAKKKIENTDDYFTNLGAYTAYQIIGGYPGYDFFGTVSLRRRLDNFEDAFKEKKRAERTVGQRKVMTQLKDLTTTQIGADTANWFAVHYVGAFAGSNQTYIGRLVSFLKTFGGPGGISSDEFAAVPYPKTAKKLNDSLATGKHKTGEEFHKIGMVLNGTITGIFSDDVHSDTFSSARQSRGLGGDYNPEEGFVRFPGGEQSGKQADAAGEFMKFDKPILDLAAAEEEIANSDVYPGSRGYYECFIDDWYAEGIVCNWNDFEREFNPDPFIFGKQGVDDVIEFLKVIKDKKIKIYDENFDDKGMSYDRLCDMFSFILAKSGIMEFKENPDGSLTGPLDYLKLPMSKPKLPIDDK